MRRQSSFVPAALDLRDHLGGVLLAEAALDLLAVAADGRARQAGQRVGGQRVDVGVVARRGCRSRSCAISDSPSPSMFIADARREVLEAALQLRGTRRVLAAPDDLVLGAVQRRCRSAGTSAGITHGCASGGRRLSTGPTTRGMTSPAFSTSTQSPSRMSLRAMSSALCSVAIETVEPARNTGSSTANGVTAPVRPTFTSIFRSSVVFCSAGNLKAIAQRGNLLVVPRRAAQRERVDLDDDAVGVEVERAALLGPLAAEGDQRVDARAAAPVRFDGQPPGAELFERCRAWVVAGGPSGPPTSW